MSRSFGQTTVTGETLATTTDAIRFLRDDGTEFWVPRSVCLEGDSVEEGDTDLIVANWWLEKEGLS